MFSLRQDITHIVGYRLCTGTNIVTTMTILTVKCYGEGNGSSLERLQTRAATVVCRMNYTVIVIRLEQV